MDAADAELARETEEVLGEPPVSIVELPHAGRITNTRHVWRVATATRQAVCKVIAVPGLGSDDPSDPYYAAREPVLYERGLPDVFVDAGVFLPELLAAVHRPDAVALWLAVASGDTGAALTPAHYRRVAERLGRAQGVASGADRPWSRGFLTAYLTSWNDVGWERVFDDDAWNRPLIRAHFSDDLRHALVQLCADRAEILSWADRLPQVVCHNDVWLNNIFDRVEHTTLIDWAFSGHGAVGTDPGNMITDSCGDLLLPTELLPELDAAATAGYWDGLRAAAWRGTYDDMRLGICLMGAKWAWLTPHMLRLAEREQHRVYGGERSDADHLFHERARVLRFNVELADEARARAASR